jgi:hypothetical protein
MKPEASTTISPGRYFHAFSTNSSPCIAGRLKSVTSGSAASGASRSCARADKGSEKAATRQPSRSNKACMAINITGSSPTQKTRRPRAGLSKLSLARPRHLRWPMHGKTAGGCIRRSRRPAHSAQQWRTMGGDNAMGQALALGILALVDVALNGHMVGASVGDVTNCADLELDPVGLPVSEALSAPCGRSAVRRVCRALLLTATWISCADRWRLGADWSSGHNHERRGCSGLGVGPRTMGDGRSATREVHHGARRRPACEAPGPRWRGWGPTNGGDVASGYRPDASAHGLGARLLRPVQNVPDVRRACTGSLGRCRPRAGRDG